MIPYKYTISIHITSPAGCTVPRRSVVPSTATTPHAGSTLLAGKPRRISLQNVHEEELPIVPPMTRGEIAALRTSPYDNHDESEVEDSEEEEDDEMEICEEENNNKEMDQDTYDDDNVAEEDNSEDIEEEEEEESEVQCDTILPSPEIVSYKPRRKNRNRNSLPASVVTDRLSTLRDRGTRNKSHSVVPSESAQKGKGKPDYKPKTNPTPNKNKKKVPQKPKKSPPTKKPTKKRAKSTVPISPETSKRLKTLRKRTSASQ